MLKITPSAISPASSVIFGRVAARSIGTWCSGTIGFPVKPVNE